VAQASKRVTRAAGKVADTVSKVPGIKQTKAAVRRQVESHKKSLPLAVTAAGVSDVVGAARGRSNKFANKMRGYRKAREIHRALDDARTITTGLRLRKGKPMTKSAYFTESNGDNIAEEGSGMLPMFELVVTKVAYRIDGMAKAANQIPAPVTTQPVQQVQPAPKKRSVLGTAAKVGLIGAGVGTAAIAGKRAFNVHGALTAARKPAGIGSVAKGTVKSLGKDFSRARDAASAAGVYSGRATNAMRAGATSLRKNLFR
jgi:hypothetical protein